MIFIALLLGSIYELEYEISSINNLIVILKILENLIPMCWTLCEIGTWLSLVIGFNFIENISKHTLHFLFESQFNWRDVSFSFFVSWNHNSTTSNGVTFMDSNGFFGLLSTRCMSIIFSVSSNLVTYILCSPQMIRYFTWHIVIILLPIDDSDWRSLASCLFLAVYYHELDMYTNLEGCLRYLSCDLP